MQQIIFTGYFDGATEPVNPGGNMGIGACLYFGNRRILEHSSFIVAKKGNTNNIAEYLAFKQILIFIKSKGYQEQTFEIYGDSKLVIEQMNGNWSMKGGLYIPFAQQCRTLLTELKEIYNNKFILQWIPRHLNSYADELSKRELQNHGVQFRLQKPMLNAAQ